MNRKIGTLLLAFIIGTTSCSSSFIARTKKQNIKLKGVLENSIKVGTENNKVLILFDKNELIRLFQNDLLDFNDQRIQLIVNELKSLKSDLIFSVKEWSGKVKFTEYELKFHDLLKKGKGEVIDKSSNNKIKRIKYTYIEDKLGGQDGYFSFENGEEFYRVLLAYGE